MAKLSASGEWLVAESTVPNCGPVEMQTNSKFLSCKTFDMNNFLSETFEFVFSNEVK